ncbi:MAG: 1,2-phenylacetyl-CoA epoxidase subunit PaaE [Gammaproteobacteria bacterium]
MTLFTPLKVAQVQQQTRDTIAVTFAVPPELKSTFAYQHGQHLTLRAFIDGEEVRRSYSICSAVQDGALRVAIKRTPGGLFSNWALEHIQPGREIEVMAPAGHFNVALAAHQRRHYLAVAAGSGITPILSIIKTTLIAEPASRFTLIYGNRATSSVIFRDELADLKDQYMERFTLAYVMSREAQDIELFNGRITREKCQQLFRHWVRIADIDVAFLCGPGDMIDAVSAALKEAGMPAGDIHAELFAAAPAPDAQRTRRLQRGLEHAHAQQAHVTLVMDGNRTSFDMERERESILDAGLRAGLDMRYSCKAGVCSTCRCKLIEGKVEMDATYALEDYEIARGFILSCQSFPLTDTVVVDFDQAD